MKPFAVLEAGARIVAEVFRGLAAVWHDAVRQEAARWRQVTHPPADRRAERLEDWWARLTPDERLERYADLHQRGRSLADG